MDCDTHNDAIFVLENGRFFCKSREDVKKEIIQLLILDDNTYTTESINKNFKRCGDCIIVSIFNSCKSFGTLNCYELMMIKNCHGFKPKFIKSIMEKYGIIHDYSGFMDLVRIQDEMLKNAKPCGA